MRARVMCTSAFSGSSSNQFRELLDGPVEGVSLLPGIARAMYAGA